VDTTNELSAPREDAKLSLCVFPAGDTLVWEVVNAGEHSVRLWRQTNSWGWSMPQLFVAPEAGSATPLHLAPAAKIWTRNTPGSVELAPHESARYEVRAGDFDPTTLSAVRDFSQRPVWVRGVLVCEPSAQAVEHGVWVGTLRGAEQELSPPHAWMRPTPEPSDAGTEATREA
jgi:hypothetical protein